MFDFPNSPTNGQIATGPGGIQYQFDGVKWTAVNSASPGFAPLFSPVFTGDPQAPTPPPNDNDQSIPNTAWVQGAVTRPNKLINPFMEIDQEHEGAGVSGGGFVADGFHLLYVSGSGGVGSAVRSMSGGPVGTPAMLSFLNSTAASSVGATDQAGYVQVIEAEDLYDTGFGTANAKPLTLSFWAQASISGTYYLSVSNNAAPGRYYVAPFTITAVNTWQLFTFTIPGDTSGTWAISGNTGGMAVRWAAAAGTTYQTPTLNAWQTGTNLFGATGMSNAFMTTTNALFRLGPAKLEVGPQATPNLRQSFQAELARCQRYYEKSWDIGVPVGTTYTTGGQQGVVLGAAGVSGWGLTVQTFYRVTKRASPTVTIYAMTGATASVSYMSNPPSSWAVTPAGVYASRMGGHSVSNTNVAAYSSIAYDFVADARL